MSRETLVLKEVCRFLEEAKVPYMLTGSFAANFYAVPRLTRDIDFVIEIFKLDIERFCQIFEKDFYMSQEALRAAIEHQGMFNIIHNESIFKIDFIVRKNEPYRKAEFQRKQQVDFEGDPIWIVSPEDLIISKLFWAKDSLSEMQIKDVRNLLSNLKKLDYAYINQWVQELGLSPIYEKVEVNA